MKFLKIKSADMPTKPKPTEQLPNNLMYVWDPNANDWIILQKDTNKATPPLYDPNNQNVATNTTTYMSNIKSASVINGEEDENPLSVKLSDLFLSDSSLVDSYLKKEISCNDILNILGIEIKNENEYKEVCNYVKEFIEDNYMRGIKSSSSLSVLPKLLDKVWYDYDEETAGKYAQIGSWEIGLGGYDTGYEVSYNGTPIFSITEDNELKPYMSDDRLQKDFGFSYSDVEKALKKHRDMTTLKRVGSTQNHSFYIKEDFPSFDGDTRVAVIEEDEDGEIFDWNYFDTMEEAEEFERKMNKKVKSDKEKTIQEYEEMGLDITDLLQACQYVHYGFYDEIKKKWSPEKLYQYLQDRLQKAQDNPQTAKFEKNWTSTRFPEALKLILHWLDTNVETTWKELDSQASKKVKSEKSMMELAQNIIYDAVLIHKAKSMDERPEWDGTFAILTLNPEKTDIVDIKYIPQSSLPSYTPNDNEYGLVRTRDTGFDDTDYQLQPLEMIINQRKSDSFAKDDKNVIESGYKKQSSCLSKFLDGPRYSKEIKIEAGLIKNGLVKYAGFDFNRGTKYAITEKGLKVLRSAAEKEHNEALNEKEKLAYMFGFNTDKETTLDTTGKTIKADDKDIIVIDTGSGYLQVFENGDAYDYGGYSVGEQLYEFSINDEDRRNGKATLDVDDLLNSKFYGIIFEDFDKLEWFVQNIKDSNTQQEIKNLLNKEAKGVYSSKNTSNRRYTIIEADGTPLGKVTASSELDAKVKFGIEHPEYADSQSLCAKEIKSGLEYNGSFEYNDYKIDLFNDTDGGTTFVIYAPKGKTVNNESMYKGTASTMDEAITKAYKIIDGSKEINAQYEQTTNTKEPYPNPSETPHDDIVLENHDGWVNTAEQKVTPEFAQLHSILGEYKKNGHILSITQDGKDLLVSCSPIASYEMKQKFEQLGYECEETDESETGDAYDLPSYTLRIKMK